MKDMSGLDPYQLYICSECQYVALGKEFIEMESCRCGGERLYDYDSDGDFDPNEVYEEARKQFRKERGIYPRN